MPPGSVWLPNRCVLQVRSLPNAPYPQLLLRRLRASSAPNKNNGPRNLRIPGTVVSIREGLFADSTITESRGEYFLFVENVTPVDNHVAAHLPVQ